jgi:hypothetical protein
MVSELDAALDGAGLSNSDKAKAKALTGAITSLVQSPEPEWKLIAGVLIALLDSQPVRAAINGTAIAGMIGGLLSL